MAVLRGDVKILATRVRDAQQTPAAACEAATSASTALPARPPDAYTVLNEVVRPIALPVPATTQADWSSLTSRSRGAGQVMASTEPASTIGKQFAPPAAPPISAT